MNHAKLETYYRIFDASIVPVCAGGCARLTEALAARLGRKVTDTARGAGAPRSAKAHPTVGDVRVVTRSADARPALPPGAAGPPKIRKSVKQPISTRF